MYKRNITLLYLLSMLTGLSFASALVVPFFMSNGLSQTQIMLLQTVFSASVVLFEVPTGYVADHFGRVTSLRLGGLATSAGFLAYGFLNGFGQFMIAELVLALGFALFSGAVEALAYDSLLADGNETQFRRFVANRQSFAWMVVAFCAPLGSLIAVRWGLRSVLVLDGVLAVLGFMATLLMKEPPLHKIDQTGRHPLRDMREVFRYCLRGHQQLPYLIGLSALLSAMTYFGFWFAPTYYASVGIPLAWFGFILALRSLLKAALSQMHGWMGQKLSDRQQLLLYSGVGVGVYVLLATFRQPWAIVFLAGFDAIQALHKPVVDDKLQKLTPSHIRAQVGSVTSLASRAAYGILGPLFGLGIDRSVGLGLLFCAVVFATLTFGVLFRLKQKGGL